MIKSDHITRAGWQRLDSGLKQLCVLTPEGKAIY